ncbi:hypothetical protein RIF25_01885 [Thermosynechococcaceae cyanobacterium BACA0444]|uniref:Uncharacterized protein n=1 Tax=Pseudocalidococcus azoricus BACA0444 TaxID=2918990 RepID=A0AAE4FP65_9CYAN|nr:hypothetical protein [Pseudocalidococcus azoricus BACA0444]
MIAFEVYTSRPDERLKSIEEKIELRFQALDEKVDAIKPEISDLRTQQRATDSRILTFIFTALVATPGLLAKVVFFDTKA